MSYDQSFFLDCIDRTLTHVMTRDQYSYLKLFSDKKYRLILLYAVMRYHYVSQKSKSEIDFLPTKENFYQYVAPSTSRLSLTKFIDRMVETKVLLKKTYDNDKRMSLILPSHQLIVEFESMHSQREEKLKENKISPIPMKSLLV